LILDYPSHTGTENVIMAACLAQGTTTIENASIEPEVADLIAFLCAMGARINGAGTNTIQIEGTGRLHGACFSVMPDRMVAGTYALGALVTAGDVAMSGVVGPYLGALTHKMREAGAEVFVTPNEYRVRYAQPLRGVDIQTYPYPGFPTDLQAPFTTAMTQAEGNSSITETMFDGRLQYTNELVKMGAVIDVSVSGRYAMVHGSTKLQGTEVKALDIRSGAALVVAALTAEGTTQIHNVSYIDRGYQDIDQRLSALGAVVKRVAEENYACPSIDQTEPVEWSALSPTTR
jgi:UDP-N-acetylglucosamine 1-carboxyvinyltransferase